MFLPVLHLSFNRAGGGVGVWGASHRVLHRARGPGLPPPYPRDAAETSHTAIHGRQKYQKAHGHYPTTGAPLVVSFVVAFHYILSTVTVKIDERKSNFLIYHGLLFCVMWKLYESIHFKNCRYLLILVLLL